MRMMWWRKLWGALAGMVVGLFLLQPGCAWAYSVNLDGEQVSVLLESPFSEMPNNGTVPLRIRVKNDYSSRATWQVRLVSSVGYGSDEKESSMTVEISVDGKSSKEVNVIFPLPLSRDSNQTSFRPSVIGPGFSGIGGRSVYRSTPYAANKQPFAILGDDLLGTSGLSPLEKKSKGSSSNFSGGSVSAATLPEDWRAYAGVDTLLLLDKEWLSLSRTQQNALADYVALGGSLVLFTTGTASEVVPRLQLPGGSVGRYGFGSIAILPIAEIPPSPERLTDTISKRHAWGHAEVDAGFGNWLSRKSLGNITVATAYVLGFVLVFGILVGPVNLFVLAPGKKRFRLFWTTPLLSLSACVLLMLSILISDGVGGRGIRTVLIFSLPESNREVVLQEQVVRTALLLSTYWRNTQGYLITPVSRHSLEASAMNGKGGIGDLSSTHYWQEGERTGGDWFHSRSVVGQYLQLARPSRATLTIVNREAVLSQGASPVVLSSYPSELKDVFLIDNEGRYWRCQNLAPGHKQDCKSVSLKEYQEFNEKLLQMAGGKIRPALHNVQDERGCYYATGTVAEESVLTTLTDIKWQTTEGIFIGRWLPPVSPVAPEATEAVPEKNSNKEQPEATSTSSLPESFNAKVGL